MKGFRRALMRASHVCANEGPGCPRDGAHVHAKRTGCWVQWRGAWCGWCRPAADLVWRGDWRALAQRAFGREQCSGMLRYHGAAVCMAARFRGKLGNYLNGEIACNACLSDRLASNEAATASDNLDELL